MQTEESRAIAAVVVTLDPGVEALELVLRAVAPQVSSIVIIDNSSSSADRVRALLEKRPIDKCTLVSKGRNIGLAAAQNEGIALAMRDRADFVLLLDQDSIPAPSMAAQLMDALESAAPSGGGCAAAGPLFTEAVSQSDGYFVAFGRLGVRRVRCDGRGESSLCTDLLISSGMLIPCPVLRDVGVMNESLFVDHVDTEWCMRARAKGYRMLGVCSAKMTHRLGDGPSRAIAGRQLYFRSPTRHYFIFRNSLLLYRKAYVPLVWKIDDATRLLMMLAAIAVLCTPRIEHVKAILCGIADGLRGRAGPRP